ncbi:MAG: hypothetical protein Q9171_006016 [Xanthocarpia ochracea]
MATLFSIPLDVLNQILGYLDHRNVQSLSFTCKDAFHAWVVKKHIYRQLFAKSDRSIMTDIGLKDQYCRFRRFLDSLNDQTGPLVQQIAIPRYMKKSDLAIINRNCCNLVSVDFMCIEEAVDFMLYCPLQLDDHFSFKFALDSYPHLFRKLKALSIRFEPQRHVMDGHIPDYDFSTSIQRPDNLLLPMLEAAPQLQSLTLQASHINPTDNIYPSEPDDNLLVRQLSMFCGTRNLTTVTLLGFPEVLASSVGPVWAWDIFTSAKVVKVSLHSDLKAVEKVYMRRYVEALKAGSARGTFMIESLDTSEAVLHPLEVQEATRLSSEDMRYLRSIGWEPCFDWTRNYLVDSRRLEREGYWYSELKTSFQARMTKLTCFIDRLRECGILVNVRFEPGTEHGIFFPNFRKPSACPERYLPNPDTSEWFVKELGYHFDELTMLWGAYVPFPDTYPCHAIYSDTYPDGVPGDDYARFFGVRPGGLTLLEKTKFPGVHDPAALVEKLQREAYGVGPLFDAMRRWCPNIHRLALYIPAAIYADTDQEFIDFVLPQGDFVWAVKHEGSGGGKEALPLLPRGSPTVVKVVNDLKLTTKEYRAECQRLNEKRCPMIHRVFTRTDAASESDASKNRKRLRTERLGSEEEEWGYGQPITITDLIAAEDDRTLLVDMN